MTTLQTGIAIVLAIIVVGVFFLFPGLSPFKLSGTPVATSTASAAASTSVGEGASTTPTGLQVTDVTIGTGVTVKAGDTIVGNYVGMLPDGTVFDASANHGGPATFQIGVGQVIPGWDAGIIGMKEGGKRHLVIPPDLAYGADGYPGVIPPNSTLTFDVELVKVNPPAAK